MTIATATRAQCTIRRSYPAAIEEVWAFWTTAARIEASWGPAGFEVRVESLDLHPGGTLDYVMTAVADGQVAFMRQSGVPRSIHCRDTYAEVAPGWRLSYSTLQGVVSDVEPCEIATVVEFEESGDITDVAITCDAMHDHAWTDRMRAATESQMRKLDALVGLTTALKTP